ncbi:V-type ATP synthase subunit E [Pyrococcus yayanosii]|uniref:A-type ATP synthase subunit E n=1 Tax=Pyrococcus yayanosii (strain CH1 / JCM 16557) TaxID=529709 RepID=F8AJH1_PYRYC|nr:V-type ATP synthase subunit E [Pyrococcus yayanosii]AEH25237.1 V-type ATP synthase subunit E [Pyrococcus yayanosii CH1]
MNGAKLIINEINREAEQKIKYVLEEAEKEAAKIREEARKRAEDRAEWILRKAQTQGEMEKQRVIANAKLEVRRKRLALQEELIEEALNAIRDRLANLPKAEYLETIKGLLKASIEELGEEKVRVSSNEETLKLIAENIDEIKAFLRESLGREVSLELGEKIETIGGVVVENQDGSVRVDNTFEARMERMIGELRATIARILFG